MQNNKKDIFNIADLKLLLSCFMEVSCYDPVLRWILWLYG